MSIGERPLPPEERPVASALDAGRTRRHALYVIGGSALYILGYGGFKIANQLITNEYWPDNTTEISLVPGSGTREPPADSPQISPWVAFGGLGRQHNLDQATLVAGELLGEAAAWTKVGGLNYENQGIDKMNIARRLDEFTNGYNGVNVLGHSMGALTALESFLHMENPVHIDTFVAVSSPSGLNDVYRSDEVDLAVDKFKADGDAFEKFVFRIMSDHKSDRGDVLSRVEDVVNRAWQETSRGVSPKVYVDALKIIYWAQLALTIVQLAARGIITTNTKFYYLRAPDNRDGTVKSQQACDSYGQCLRAVRVPFEPHVFSGGHADTRAALTVLRPKYWSYLMAEAPKVKHRRQFGGALEFY